LPEAVRKARLAKVRARSCERLIQIRDRDRVQDGLEVRPWLRWCGVRAQEDGDRAARRPSADTDRPAIRRAACNREGRPIGGEGIQRRGESVASGPTRQPP
jgi:hypothetical protein